MFALISHWSRDALYLAASHIYNHFIHMCQFISLEHLCKNKISFYCIDTNQAYSIMMKSCVIFTLVSPALGMFRALRAASKAVQSTPIRAAPRALKNLVSRPQSLAAANGGRFLNAVGRSQFEPIGKRWMSSQPPSTHIFIDTHAADNSFPPSRFPKFKEAHEWWSDTWYNTARVFAAKPSHVKVGRTVYTATPGDPDFKKCRDAIIDAILDKEVQITTEDYMKHGERTLYHAMELHENDPLVFEVRVTGDGTFFHFNFSMVLF